VSAQGCELDKSPRRLCNCELFHGLFIAYTAFQNATQVEEMFAQGSLTRNSEYADFLAYEPWSERTIQP
jgi:hypothetical protein